MTYRSIAIDFLPQDFDAFHVRDGAWTNYDAVQAAGLRSLRGTIRIECSKRTDDLVIVDVNVFFDPDAFPSDTFGLVYLDGTFGQAVQTYLARIFPPVQFGEPGYTEQGMQGVDYVSMEYGRAFMEQIDSAHALLALHQHPLVASVDVC